MAENNLVTLLGSLTKSELNEFDKFLRSPFFMEGRNLRSKVLYKYFCLLRKYHPEFNSRKFNKETLFIEIYPGNKYNDTLMRRLDSDLGKLTFEFITQKELNSNKLTSAAAGLKALSKRKLNKLFQKNLGTAQDLIDIQKYDSDHYYHKQRISSIRNNHAYTKADMLKIYDLQPEAENFINYTLCRSLEIYRNIENDKAILNLSYNTGFYENILTYIHDNKTLLKQNDYLAMHYYEIMLNLKKEDGYYYSLKELKNKLAGRLERETLRNIYVTLVNYCIRKTNMGFIEFRKERFELDNEIMEAGTHYSGGYFDMNYFLSSVRNAASQKEFIWAEKFIEKYRELLEPKHKMFALNFALGALSYGKKNYGEALEFLSRINIEYSARKQQVKNLMLIIFYETGAYENALNIIDTGRHVLKNDKQIPVNRKRSFMDFLKHSHDLLNLKLYPDKDKLEEFIQKITKKEYFVYKDWLLEKASEIK